MWLSYIRVPDAKKAAATIKKLGGRIINGPMEVPGGSWIAGGLDLQGAAFAVHSPRPSPEKSQPRKAAAKQGKKTPKKKTPATKQAPARKHAPARKKKPAGKKTKASSRKKAASRKRR